MFSATLWVVAARWGIRAIGLVSTVVLARLLTPADFGIIALAMLVVGLIEMMARDDQSPVEVRYPRNAAGLEEDDEVWGMRPLGQHGRRARHPRADRHRPPVVEQPRGAADHELHLVIGGHSLTSF